MDNGQFTEEQRSEAYRLESMQHLIRQTKALESIRTILLTFSVLIVVGMLIWFVFMLATASGGL